MNDFLWLLLFIFCIYLFIAPKGLKEIPKYDDSSSKNSNKREIIRCLKENNRIDTDNREDNF